MTRKIQTEHQGGRILSLSSVEFKINSKLTKYFKDKMKSYKTRKAASIGTKLQN